MSDYKHYDKMCGDKKLDVYRFCREYNVTEPAIFQAIKKLARCGNAHKGFIQDVIEARDGLNRLLEMANEDKDEALTVKQYMDIEEG